MKVKSISEQCAQLIARVMSPGSLGITFISNLFVICINNLLFIFVSWNWVTTEYQMVWIFWARARSWLISIWAGTKSRIWKRCSLWRNSKTSKVLISLTMKRRTWTTTGRKSSVLYPVCGILMGELHYLQKVVGCRGTCTQEHVAWTWFFSSY